jgi:aspartyl-tRNA(Asn)/glutamyl-tRNA(Gln) amidotransferase subunit C
MAVDRSIVESTARLARLALTEAERGQLEAQLSSILGHIAVLGEADTSQVEATARVLALENVMSPDQSRPSCSPAEMLANAPHREENYLRVRAVLEE